MSAPTDFRECDRCGRTDIIPGTAMGAPHVCLHKRPCVAASVESSGCASCRAERAVEAGRYRDKVRASLPGAREAMLRPGAGVAAGPAGVQRGGKGSGAP